MANTIEIQEPFFSSFSRHFGSELCFIKDTREREREVLRRK